MRRYGHGRARQGSLSQTIGAMWAGVTVACLGRAGRQGRAGKRAEHGAAGEWMARQGSLTPHHMYGRPDSRVGLVESQPHDFVCLSVCPFTWVRVCVRPCLAVSGYIFGWQ